MGVGTGKYLRYMYSTHDLDHVAEVPTGGTCISGLLESESWPGASRAGGVVASIDGGLSRPTRSLRWVRGTLEDVPEGGPRSCGRARTPWSSKESRR